MPELTGIPLFTQSINLAHREMRSEAPRQLYQEVFQNLYESKEASVRVEELTGATEALRAVEDGQQSHVRQYEAGTVKEYYPPISSEKKKIDARLRRSIIFGGSSNPGYDNMDQIIYNMLMGSKGFIAADEMEKNKAVIDLLDTGKFIKRDHLGIVDSFNFERAAGNTFTYDYSGGSFDAMVKANYDLLKAQGAPVGNLAMIIGSSHFTKFEGDSTILSRISAFQNMDTMKIMTEPYYNGVDGLTKIGTYKPNGMGVFVNIFIYNPKRQYKVVGSAAADFVGATKAYMFPMGDHSRCNLGIEVIDPMNPSNLVTRFGELVITADTMADPAAKWIIARNNFFFAFNNINYTTCCTGTNF